MTNRSRSSVLVNSRPDGEMQDELAALSSESITA